MRTVTQPTRILITGASSGIGAALAREYAGPGTSLILAGRDATRLESVAGEVRQAGGECATRVVDVTDRDGIRAWVTACDDAAPLDLVIANAGVSAGAHKSPAPGQADDARIFATNVGGLVDTIEPVIKRMLERGQGQIAVMSSLAGYFGFANAPAYCASKAAVRIYGTALRKSCAPRGVRVSVICPGFVRSPMTDRNNFHMPMLMESDRAARIIRRGLTRDRRIIAFPLPLYIAVRALSLFT